MPLPVACCTILICPALSLSYWISERAVLVGGPASAAAPSQARHPLPLEVVSFSVT